jgi:hypothetical protein
VVLRFFTLFRWMPRGRARIVDLCLRIAGVMVGTALIFQGPHFVSASVPNFAEWANLNFQICVAIVVAINIWRASWLMYTLVRERHQMLPARQH